MDFSHITITDNQQVQVVVSGAVDKKGNPAPLDGTPTFESADPAIATFVTDPSDASGMTGLLTAVGGLTTATALSITADAKIGDGVENIVANGLVEITAGQATGFSTTVGAPVEQP